jgi:hypothetical protein
MPIAYRAILTTENSDQNATTVRTEVNEWLVSKRLTPPTTNGSVSVNGKVVSHYQTSKEKWTAERWQLEEHWPEPSWFTGEADPQRKGITSITCITEGSTLWLWVEVESPWLKYRLAGSEQIIEEAQEAGTPKIVKNLIGKLNLNDGELPFVDDVLEIRENHLNALVKHLQDDSRNAALFLSVAPRDVERERWIETLRQLTRRSDGLAATVYLDPGLVSKLANLVGFGHSVPPGGIRTYLPGARPFDSEDAYRHKLLTPKTISTSSNPEKLSRLLRRALVNRLSHTKLPALLLEVDSELLRFARFRPFDSGLWGKQKGDELVAALAPVKSESEEVEFWKQIAYAYEADTTQLKREVNELRGWEGVVTELDAKVAAQLAEISRLESHIKSLQAKLSSQNRVSEAFEDFVTPIEAQLPDSFEELIKRIPEFNNLEYVGRPEDPLNLDEHTGIATALANAWNTLRTLNSYAELKQSGEFNGGFMNYSRGESKGGFLKIPELKPAESESVLNNPRLRKQREIEVPTQVDPSGRIIAEMHVALQNMNNYPRMYFFDATGINGKIYIGYIGEHLDNTRTN